MWAAVRVCHLGLLFLGLGWVHGQSQTNFTRPVFLCGGHLVTDSGFVASEGFPSHYKANSKCTWYITVPEGHVVMLQFRIFDLEADPTCRYDYVDVYNGHSYTVQKLGRFCGTFRPGALISTSNTMMLEMASDSSTGGRGFLAYFSGGKPHVDEHQFCGGRLTKPQGSVKTPNWPESDYPAGISCSWHISVESNMVIEVKFEKLDLELDTYCRYDYVALFNGGETDDSRRIGKFCGDTVPDAVVTNGNELLVHFVSDLSVTAAGFMAHYRSVPRGSRTPTADLDTVHGPRVNTSPTKPTVPPQRVKPKPTPKPPSRPFKPVPPRPTPKTRSNPAAKPKPVRPTPPTRRSGSKITPKPAVKVTAKPATKPTPKPAIRPQPKPTSTTAKQEVKPGVKPTAKTISKPGNRTTSRTAGNPLCSLPCKRIGTMVTRFCPSHFVLTGKVTSLSPGSQGSAEVEVSVIKVYKAGRLQLRKRGPSTSATLTATCSKCPALRKGVNYVLMGHVNDDGLGILNPSSFALQHKAVHDRALANLAKKAC
ncbi:procollagen C-endopeptidase enhancer b isoform X1 [Danio rerio]|uniref:Procollagen C-endopeptidase enhancer b isoform X1 n=1 Tax=Danio rerio TaxID=7955 RepID=A0A8M3AUI0_DANRE|nr:procollagen C-endopeptidase enhancer b isoform X1 [Danio rerio]|eukprot:XP_009301718.1 procollagen C-endopeptidase enhancer b isoform X1 [Danio rerio]